MALLFFAVDAAAQLEVLGSSAQSTPLAPIEVFRVEAPECLRSVEYVEKLEAFQIIENRSGRCWSLALPVLPTRPGQPAPETNGDAVGLTASAGVGPAPGFGHGSESNVDRQRLSEVRALALQYAGSARPIDAALGKPHTPTIWMPSGLYKFATSKPFFPQREYPAPDTTAFAVTSSTGAAFMRSDVPHGKAFHVVPTNSFPRDMIWDASGLILVADYERVQFLRAVAPPAGGKFQPLKAAGDATLGGEHWEIRAATVGPRPVAGAGATQLVAIGRAVVSSPRRKAQTGSAELGVVILRVGLASEPAVELVGTVSGLKTANWTARSPEMRFTPDEKQLLIFGRQTVWAVDLP